MDKKRVIIVGGGIAGLSAAYYLQKEGLPIEVKLIEASDRLGGVIQTVKKDGFVIEKGPDSIVATKKSGLELIEDVGLKDQVVYNSIGKSYILANGKLHSMPEGAYMGIPSRITPFAVSGLFSWKGKIRAAADFILPKGKKQTDQSLGGFFRRRLGDEIVENLIEPLLSGIYSGDIDELSLMALFPNFYQMEQTHRSLVLGLKRTIPKRPKKQPAKKGMFLSLKGGLESMVVALEQQLSEETVCKNIAVEKIIVQKSGYLLQLSNGKMEMADSVVIATDHFHAQQILRDYSFMDGYKEMTANSVANVAMAFPKSVVKQDIDGSGFIVSRNSDYRITACTWTHKKWPGSTPEGKVLFRCFLGKPNDQGIVDLTDEEIVKLALRDLNKTMNITAKPEFYVISRWKKAMPQYSIGHLERIARVKQALASELPGIFLAGGSFEGVGIPDCINQGRNAVSSVKQFLKF